MHCPSQHAMLHDYYLHALGCSSHIWYCSSGGDGFLAASRGLCRSDVHKHIGFLTAYIVTLYDTAFQAPTRVIYSQYISACVTRAQAPSTGIVKLFERRLCHKSSLLDWPPLIPDVCYL